MIRATIVCLPEWLKGSCFFSGWPPKVSNGLLYICYGFFHMYKYSCLHVVSLQRFIDLKITRSIWGLLYALNDSWVLWRDITALLFCSYMAHEVVVMWSSLLLSLFGFGLFLSYQGCLK